MGKTNVSDQNRVFIFGANDRPVTVAKTRLKRKKYKLFGCLVKSSATTVKPVMSFTDLKSGEYVVECFRAVKMENGKEKVQMELDDSLVLFPTQYESAKEFITLLNELPNNLPMKSLFGMYVDSEKRLKLRIHHQQQLKSIKVCVNERRRRIQHLLWGVKEGCGCKMRRRCGC